MRFVSATILAVVVTLMATLVFAESSKVRGYTSLNRRQSARLREIRGIKPKHISTGILYGKREDDSALSDLDRRERTLIVLLLNSPEGLRPEWILREMKTNPAFAKLLMKVVINDLNGQSSTEEQLKPEVMTLF